MAQTIEETAQWYSDPVIDTAPELIGYTAPDITQTAAPISELRTDIPIPSTEQMSDESLAQFAAAQQIYVPEPVETDQIRSTVEPVTPPPQTVQRRITDALEQQTGGMLGGGPAVRTRRFDQDINSWVDEEIPVSQFRWSVIDGKHVPVSDTNRRLVIDTTDGKQISVNPEVDDQWKLYTDSVEKLGGLSAAILPTEQNRAVFNAYPNRFSRELALMDLYEASVTDHGRKIVEPTADMSTGTVPWITVYPEQNVKSEGALPGGESVTWTGTVKVPFEEAKRLVTRGLARVATGDEVADAERAEQISTAEGAPPSGVIEHIEDMGVTAGTHILGFTEGATFGLSSLATDPLIAAISPSTPVVRTDPVTGQLVTTGEIPVTSDDVRRAREALRETHALYNISEFVGAVAPAVIAPQTLAGGLVRGGTGATAGGVIEAAASLTPSGLLSRAAGSAGRAIEEATVRGFAPVGSSVLRQRAAEVGALAAGLTVNGLTDGAVSAMSYELADQLAQDPNVQEIDAERLGLAAVYGGVFGGALGAVGTAIPAASTVRGLVNDALRSKLKPGERLAERLTEVPGAEPVTTSGWRAGEIVRDLETVEGVLGVSLPTQTLDQLRALDENTMIRFAPYVDDTGLKFTAIPDVESVISSAKPDRVETLADVVAVSGGTVQPTGAAVLGAAVERIGNADLQRAVFRYGTPQRVIAEQLVQDLTDPVVVRKVTRMGSNLDEQTVERLAEANAWGRWKSEKDANGLTRSDRFEAAWFRAHGDEPLTNETVKQSSHQWKRVLEEERKKIVSVQGATAQDVGPVKVSELVNSLHGYAELAVDKITREFKPSKGFDGVNVRTDSTVQVLPPSIRLAGLTVGGTPVSRAITKKRIADWRKLMAEQAAGQREWTAADHTAFSVDPTSPVAKQTGKLVFTDDELKQLDLPITQFTPEGGWTDDDLFRMWDFQRWFMAQKETLSPEQFSNYQNSAIARTQWRMSALAGEELLKKGMLRREGTKLVPTPAARPWMWQDPTELTGTGVPVWERTGQIPFSKPVVSQPETVLTPELDARLHDLLIGGESLGVRRRGANELNVPVETEIGPAGVWAQANALPTKSRVRLADPTANGLAPRDITLREAIDMRRMVVTERTAFLREISKRATLARERFIGDVEEALQKDRGPWAQLTGADRAAIRAELEKIRGLRDANATGVDNIAEISALLPATALREQLAKMSKEMKIGVAGTEGQLIDQTQKYLRQLTLIENGLTQDIERSLKGIAETGDDVTKRTVGRWLVADAREGVYSHLNRSLAGVELQGALMQTVPSKLQELTSMISPKVVEYSGGVFGLGTGITFSVLQDWMIDRGQNGSATANINGLVGTVLMSALSGKVGGAIGKRLATRKGVSLPKRNRRVANEIRIANNLQRLKRAGDYERSVRAAGSALADQLGVVAQMRNGVSRYRSKSALQRILNPVVSDEFVREDVDISDEQIEELTNSASGTVKEIEKLITSPLWHSAFWMDGLRQDVKSAMKENPNSPQLMALSEALPVAGAPEEDLIESAETVGLIMNPTAITELAKRGNLSSRQIELWAGANPAFARRFREALGQRWSQLLTGAQVEDTDADGTVRRILGKLEAPVAPVTGDQIIMMTAEEEANDQNPRVSGGRTRSRNIATPAQSLFT